MRQMKEHLASPNRKTGYSINFDIEKTCNPTSLCREVCYARKGPISWPAAIQKQDRVLEIFKKEDPERIAYEIGEGCIRKELEFLRWCGSGDLFPEAVKVLNIIGEKYPETKHWIVTRKPGMAKRLIAAPNFYIMFSLDGSCESKQRKKLVDNYSHPRIYYSFMRQSMDEDTMGASIVFNLQQKKKQLGYDNKKTCCPVDAGIIPLEGACSKCKKCFSEGVYK